MPPASASLYRRHRPRTFADVVGQEHVVRTLRNAIEQDRVHHAYLFVGSRGTGKTSMAKILAASLNCVNGPTVTPCGTCESCRGIADASSLDVIEMDAASNNSVDDIRDLREKVAYAPVGGHHKVYILDEAHMLTPQAWNAFLKTLEEPPPHTIFVLATTEANKVLPTVVDRCHRFDFSRPTQQQIAGVLRRVADVERIEIPDEACALVARSATGSFRDALGTLEQLVSYTGSAITLDDVLAVLGAADADLLFGAVDAVDRGDAREALLAAARLADSGRDVGRFFGDLEAHLRGLMIVQTLGEVPAELAVTPEQDARLAEQAASVGPAAVLRLLDLVADALRAMKDGADPRTQLELALVKGAKPEHDAVGARADGAAGAAGERPPVARTRAAGAASGGARHAGRPRGRRAAAGARPAHAHAARAPARRDGAAPTARGTRRRRRHHRARGRPRRDRRRRRRARRRGLRARGCASASSSTSPASPSSGPPCSPTCRSARRCSTRSWRTPGRAGSTAASSRSAWAESAAFYKRKAEEPACRQQIADAIRTVTGSSLRLAYALADDDAHADHATATEPALSDDELIDRFKVEFEAEELSEEEES